MIFRKLTLSMKMNLICLISATFATLRAVPIIAVVLLLAVFRGTVRVKISLITILTIMQKLLLRPCIL